MKSNFIIQQTNEIPFVATSHQIGKKQILITNSFCESNLMQAAIGTLAFGDTIEAHRHPTMEEFFLFMEGESLFVIDNKNYICNKGDFIKIPKNTLHSLKANSNIQFVYWGVSV